METLAQQIKELREKTGAGMADIKKALEESGGRMEEAVFLIEKKLGAIAGKRMARETKAGVVDAYIHSNGRIGVLLELFSETDFVARNPQFRSLAHDLAMQVAAMDPADGDILLGQSFVRDQSRSVQELIREVAGKFGENIKVGRFTRFEL